MQIVKNEWPKFVSTPQTLFEVPLNGELVYEIPSFIDERELDFEGGDVYVSRDKNKPELYPPFMRYMNATKTIVLKPDQE